MNYQNKTKEAVIKELQKLQWKYDSLKKTYSHDISECKVIEKELEESEERYRLLFENSGEAILLTNPDGSIYAANPEACRMYGWSEAEICKLGRNCLADLSDPYLDSALKEREKNGKFKGELKQVRKDGSIFPAEVTSTIFMDSHGIKRTSMFIREITERKAAEGRLKESESEFRSLFENSMMGISLALPGGNLSRINNAYSELYGYPDPETMLKEVSNSAKGLYSDPDDRKKVFEILDKNGYMPPTEFELNRRNGEKFWALVSAKHVKDNKGNLLFLQAEHIDITSQKRMEAELRKSKNSLEKLNQHLNIVRENERSQIALNLHDDFGQRLTALNLDIAWMKSRIGVQSLPVRKKLEEMSKMIHESIESIREVSSFLRPAILYDLGLISAFEWQLKKFEEQSGIKFQFSFAPGNIRIDDSISLILYRILQETLTNIIRHSEATVIDIDLRLIENSIEMLIKDNGKGIDEHEINSLKSMGIAGIKERIRSVYGSVSIKGEKGTGTLIKISIPLKHEKND